MGIKGLAKFVKEQVPSSISKKSLTDLSGKVLAIDTNYYLYKYTISTDDYLHKFLKQYEHLRSYGIRPIYILDGKPPSEKMDVIEKRKRINDKKKIDVSVEKIKALKRFFNKNQICYIEGDSEADFICSKLSNIGKIHGCISDDMDFLALGCKYLYREYFQHSSEVVEYTLEPILEKYSREQFIDICIFLGCDYCDRVYDFINRSKTIDIHQLFTEYQTLENVWNYLRSNDFFMYVDEEKEHSVQQKWAKAREILGNNICTDQKRIDIALDRVYRLTDHIPCLIDFDVEPPKDDFTYIQIVHKRLVPSRECFTHLVNHNPFMALV